MRNRHSSKSVHALGERAFPFHDDRMPSLSAFSAPLRFIPIAVSRFHRLHGWRMLGQPMRENTPTRWVSAGLVGKSLLIGVIRAIRGSHSRI